MEEKGSIIIIVQVCVEDVASSLSSLHCYTLCYNQSRGPFGVDNFSGLRAELKSLLNDKSMARFGVVLIYF